MCGIMSKRKITSKEKILKSICLGARKYKKVFLNYEYQITSKSFSLQKIYIISATKSNYLHLTGVHTKLSAIEFYESAYKKTLTIQDFDYNKKGQSAKIVMGSVKCKVKFLPHLEKIFSKTTVVEEKFVKGQISCTFAVSENSFTLGFIAVPVCRPKTLLKGNKLKNPSQIDSLKRRKKGTTVFKDFLK